MLKARLFTRLFLQMRNLGWRLHRWASDRRLLSWQFMYILNRCCNKERGEEKQGVQGFKILWLVLVEGGGVMTTWDEEISEKCTPVLFQWLPVLLCLFVVVFFFGLSSLSACYYHSRYCFLPILLSFFPHARSCPSLHNSTFSRLF